MLTYALEEVEIRRKKYAAEIAAMHIQLEENDKENKRIRRSIERLELIYQADIAEKGDREKSRGA